MSVYPARLRNQALYSFINPPVSLSYPSPKVNRVSVMFLMVTACVRSLSGVSVCRTVVTSHLWATQTSGLRLPLLLTRTPTTVLPMLPLGSHHLTRYEVWTTGQTKDFQMTKKSPCGRRTMLAAGCMSEQHGRLNRLERCIYLCYFCLGSWLEILAIVQSNLFRLLPAKSS